jgi:hypothetical protein
MTFDQVRNHAIRRIVFKKKNEITRRVALKTINNVAEFSIKKFRPLISIRGSNLKDQIKTDIRDATRVYLKAFHSHSVLKRVAIFSDSYFSSSLAITCSSIGYAKPSKAMIIFMYGSIVIIDVQ